MKKTILTLLAALVTTIAFAQSSAVQKAAKSVFTLTTYKADGSIKATTHGVYFGEKGEAIAAFTPFIGASSAVIIDAAGKKAEVTAIVGANEMYDICRFQTTANSSAPLRCASSAEGKLWAVGYSTKKPSTRQLNIASREQFQERYTYFIYKEDIGDDEEGCPILNEAGELVGLVARSASSYTIHSTDANFYNELKATGFAAHDRYLQKTSIRPALPDDLEQARLMLVMLESTTDSLKVESTVNEFNQKFPTEIEGYSTMARYQMAHNNLQAASKAMETAIKKAADKAEAHSRYSELIYNRALYMPDTLAHWTIDAAEEQIKLALAQSDQPAYRHHLARIVFVKGDFDAAYGIFESVTNSELESSEVYYEMAQCKANLGAEKQEVLALLTKSVEKSPQPLTAVSAPYFYARGNWLQNMGENKRALADYLVYDSLMLYNAPADFYYQRYQLETEMRQYQQALNDIAHAAYLQPGDVSLLAEMASLQLRVNRLDDAIATCDLSLTITQDYADIYIVRGLALARLDRKEEARADLQKAKALGDERAEGYIEKYCK